MLVLGEATAAPRRGRCCTSPGRSGRTCSRSRSTAERRSSSSTGSCAPTGPDAPDLPDEPGARPAASSRSAATATEDLSWVAEWEHFADGARRRGPLLGGLEDALYAWSRVEDAYASSAATRRCGRRSSSKRPCALPPVCLLAGGLGPGSGETVRDTPKPLLEVAGEPFLVHQLRLLRRLRRRAGGALRRLSRGADRGAHRPERFGIQIGYSYDGPALIGTLGAIRRRRRCSASDSSCSTATPTCGSTTPPPRRVDRQRPPRADDRAPQRGALGHLQRDLRGRPRCHLRQALTRPRRWSGSTMASEG